jgi:hypothetical protein
MHFRLRSFPGKSLRQLSLQEALILNPAFLPEAAFGLACPYIFLTLTA